MTDSLGLSWSPQQAVAPGAVIYLACDIHNCIPSG